MALARWLDLMDEAARQTGYHFAEDVEQYVVLTLDHFITDKSLASMVIATDFLTALESIGRQGAGQMRQVGDKCLLLAGLFPERAQRKRLPVDYFIKMGQQAYHILTQSYFHQIYNHDLFSQLSADFPHLILVLQRLRNIK